MTTGSVMNAGLFILTLGLILYFGVISSYLFSRFKIPDVLNLILIGLILGPALHLISPALLTPWMSVVGAIALSLILFEGGLDLDIDQILDRFGFAFIISAGSFLTTAVVIALIYRWLVHAPLIHCLLLGSTLGCVSSAVILPISNLLNITKDAKTTIHLDAALSDMFGVVFTLVLLRLDPNSLTAAGTMFNSIVGSFTTAIFGALFFGLAWLWALSKLQDSPFAYMMTLAALFVLYGLIEFFHGSGPMAALTFGAVLTNADKIAQLFNKKFEFMLDDKIRQFNTEAAFFVRTFFFVYLGLVVSVRSFDLQFFLIMFSILFSILGCRYLVVRSAIRFLYSSESVNTHIYLSMIPRGLTSAVLVGMIQSQISGTEMFLEFVFAIILLTNIVMTLWVYRNERNFAQKNPAEEKI